MNQKMRINMLYCLFFVIGVSFFLCWMSSCSADVSEAMGRERTPMWLAARIGKENREKQPVVDDDLAILKAINAKMTFEVGDQIGVWVRQSSGNSAVIYGWDTQNMAFTTNDEALFTTESPVYFPLEKSTVDVFSIYPYSAAVVSTDVAPIKNGTDYLWAEQKNMEVTDMPVPLVFTHVMSLLIIRVELGEGYDTSIIHDVEITTPALKQTGELSIAAGVVTVTNDVTATTVLSGETTEGVAYLSLYLLPQALATDKFQIRVKSSVTTDHWNTFSIPINTPALWEKGSCYVYSLQVDKQQITIGEGDIGLKIEGWEVVSTKGIGIDRD